MTSGPRPPDVATHVVVGGRVQGVGFRQSTVHRARQSGVLGWVRNLPDGRVEAFLQGTSPAVREVLDWVQAGGPPGARVDGVEALEASPDPTLTTFAITR